MLLVPEDNVVQTASGAGTRSDGSPGAGLSEELKALVSLAVSSGIEQGLARGLQEALKVALTALRQNAAAQRSSNTNGGGHGQ